MAHRGKEMCATQFQCTLRRQYCLFKVFDVRTLKCISLCAQMRDYGHTRNDHPEKAMKARSPGLIEKKTFFTVNSLTDVLFQVN